MNDKNVDETTLRLLMEALLNDLLQAIPERKVSKIGNVFTFGIADRRAQAARKRKIADLVEKINGNLEHLAHVEDLAIRGRVALACLKHEPNFIEKMDPSGIWDIFSRARTLASASSMSIIPELCLEARTTTTPHLAGFAIGQLTEIAEIHPDQKDEVVHALLRTLEAFNPSMEIRYDSTEVGAHFKKGGIFANTRTLAFQRLLGLLPLDGLMERAVQEIRDGKLSDTALHSLGYEISEGKLKGHEEESIFARASASLRAFALEGGNEASGAFSLVSSLYRHLPNITEEDVNLFRNFVVEAYGKAKETGNSKLKGAVANSIGPMGLRFPIDERIVGIYFAERKTDWLAELLKSENEIQRQFAVVSLIQHGLQGTENMQGVLEFLHGQKPEPKISAVLDMARMHFTAHIGASTFADLVTEAHRLANPGIQADQVIADLRELRDKTAHLRMGGVPKTGNPSGGLQRGTT